MSLFKTKDPVPEVVNNHVERIVLEAKYNIKDLTRSEVELLRQVLNRAAMDRYGYYSGVKSPEKDLLDKIQL